MSEVSFSEVVQKLHRDKGYSLQEIANSVNRHLPGRLQIQRQNVFNLEKGISQHPQYRFLEGWYKAFPEFFSNAEMFRDLVGAG